MCSHIVCPHAHHALACACTHNSESMRVIAVTALDVCGTLLHNLTLALSKARLNAAIRSTTLSFPSYILLIVRCRQGVVVSPIVHGVEGGVIFNVYLHIMLYGN